MILEQLAQYLHNVGLGKFDKKGIEGDIFIETLPDKPDNALGIFVGSSEAPDLESDHKTVSLQIMIRSLETPTNPHSGYTRGETIIQALHGLHNMKFVADGDYLIYVFAMQSIPNGLGQDANRRHEYSLNFEIHYREEEA